MINNHDRTTYWSAKIDLDRISDRVCFLVGLVIRIKFNFSGMLCISWSLQTYFFVISKVFGCCLLFLYRWIEVVVALYFCCIVNFCFIWFVICCKSAIVFIVNLSRLACTNRSDSCRHVRVLVMLTLCCQINTDITRLADLLKNTAASWLAGFLLDQGPVCSVDWLLLLAMFYLVLNCLFEVTMVLYFP